MKKLIFLALLAFCFSPSKDFAEAKTTDYSVTKVNYDTDEDWVEFVCIEGQWYKIIHHSDGSIEAFPVSTVTPDIAI